MTQILIRVDGTLERFRPEIDYVLDVLRQWIGIPFLCLDENSQACANIEYSRKPSGSGIWIRECFFSKGCQIGKDGLELVRDWRTLILAENESVDCLGEPVLPLFAEEKLQSYVRSPAETEAGWEIHFDLLGAIFFQLSRIEELEEVERDHYGRFSPDQSLAFRLNFLHRPEADRHADLLRRVLKECGWVGASTKKPRVFLTHDVDRLLSFHSIRHLAREVVGNIFRSRETIPKALSGAFRQLTDGEPFTSARWLMDRAEENGVECRFFFMAGTRHPIDADYAYRWREKLTEVSAEITDRGHRIGIHPGFETWKDPDQWVLQKRALEEILNRPILEGRQHVLRFHPHTWEAWELAGMERDFSLAYPAGVCYRAGTTRSFPAYGLRTRRAFKLEVTPTAIMEFALFMTKYTKLTRKEALDLVASAVGDHRRYCGDLAVLFHPVTVMKMKEEYLATLREVFRNDCSCSA